MNDSFRTRQELIEELSILNQKIKELKISEEEHKRAEEAIRASEITYQTIFETTGTTMLIVEEDMTISLANHGFESLTGYPREEMEGKKKWTEFVEKGDLEKMVARHQLRRADSGLVTKSYEFRLVHRDGDLKNIILTVDIIPGTKRSVASLMDITDRKRAEETLLESEERYRSLADNVDFGINLIDKDFKIITSNIVSGRQFNKPAGELAGKNCFKEFEKRQTVCSHCPGVQAMATGQPHQVDTEGVRDDGSRFSARIHAFPLFCPDGTIKGFNEVVEDITEHKRTEEALRNQDIYLAKLTSCVPGMIYEFTKRPDGTYCVPFSTAAIKDIFGCLPQDVHDDFSPIARVILPDDLDKVLDSIEDSARHMTVWTCEYRVQIPGQPVRWLLGNSTPEKLTDGSITWYGFNMDITDRKRAEEALRASESRAQGMLRAIPDMMFLMDSQGTFLDYKADISDLYLQDATLIGKRNRDIAPPEFADLIDRMIRAALETGTLQTFEYQLAIPGRGVRDYETRMVASGENEVMAIVRDVTDRKQAGEEKVKLQNQLRQSHKMESVGRLAGGVAHDFNNMLGVILGHAEIALEQIDPTQPLYSDLQEIRKAAERSAALTQQLLAFARKQTISPRVLDLNETVEGMLKMLRRLIGEDIHLVWFPDVSLWPVKIDPSQINQLLVNLSVNARDAIADVGKVTIETGNITFDEAYCADHAGFVPGEYVLLAVSDDGCGMNRETLDNLFEPFFTTKDLGKGSGLGLAMVYGIVKQNNGFINVYSEPEQGSTFKIYLPRHIGKAAQLRTAVQHEPILRGEETLLVVEDEPAILDMSRLMLEKLGYQVLAASTPGEAIRLAEDHAGEIHLLLTDVVMPEMNGRDLAKKLLSLYPNIKRLFMSGYTANVIAHHGVLDEGVFFIQKPFSIKSLSTKVREALDQR
ncbi:MAG: PAS domain S-box protein [Smithellaceae bacterium]